MIEARVPAGAEQKGRCSLWIVEERVSVHTYLSHCPLNQLNSKLYLSLEKSERSAAAGLSLSLFVRFWNIPTSYSLYLRSRHRVSRKAGEKQRVSLTCTATFRLSSQSTPTLQGCPSSTRQATTKHRQHITQEKEREYSRNSECSHPGLAMRPPPRRTRSGSRTCSILGEPVWKSSRWFSLAVKGAVKPEGKGNVLIGKWNPGLRRRSSPS